MQRFLALILLLALSLACAPTIAPRTTPNAAGPASKTSNDREQLLAAGKAFFGANKLNDDLRRLELKLTTGSFEDADLPTFKSTVEQFEQQLGAVAPNALPSSLAPQVKAAGDARLKAVKWLAGSARRGSLVDTSSQEAKDWLASQSLWDTARVDLLNALKEQGINPSEVDYLDRRVGG